MRPTNGVYASGAPYEGRGNWLAITPPSRQIALTHFLLGARLINNSASLQ